MAGGGRREVLGNTGRGTGTGTADSGQHGVGDRPPAGRWALGGLEQRGGSSATRVRQTGPAGGGRRAAGGGRRTAGGRRLRHLAVRGGGRFLHDATAGACGEARGRKGASGNQGAADDVRRRATGARVLPDGDRAAGSGQRAAGSEQRARAKGGEHTSAVSSRGAADGAARRVAEVVQMATLKAGWRSVHGGSRRVRRAATYRRRPAGCGARRRREARGRGRADEEKSPEKWSWANDGRFLRWTQKGAASERWLTPSRTSRMRVETARGCRRRHLNGGNGVARKKGGGGGYAGSKEQTRTPGAPSGHWLRPTGSPHGMREMSPPRDCCGEWGEGRRRCDDRLVNAQHVEENDHALSAVAKTCRELDFPPKDGRRGVHRLRGDARGHCVPGFLRRGEEDVGDGVDAECFPCALVGRHAVHPEVFPRHSGHPRTHCDRFFRQYARNEIPSAAHELRLSTRAGCKAAARTAGLPARNQSTPPPSVPHLLRDPVVQEDGREYKLVQKRFRDTLLYSSATSPRPNASARIPSAGCCRGRQEILGRRPVKELEKTADFKEGKWCFRAVKGDSDDDVGGVATPRPRKPRKDMATYLIHNGGSGEPQERVLGPLDAPASGEDPAGGVRGFCAKRGNACQRRLTWRYACKWRWASAARGDQRTGGGGTRAAAAEVGNAKPSVGSEPEASGNLNGDLLGDLKDERVVSCPYDGDEALEMMFALVSGESVDISKSLLRFKAKYAVWDDGYRPSTFRRDDESRVEATEPIFVTVKRSGAQVIETGSEPPRKRVKIVEEGSATGRMQAPSPPRRRLRSRTKKYGREQQRWTAAHVRGSCMRVAAVSGNAKQCRGSLTHCSGNLRQLQRQSGTFTVPENAEPNLTFAFGNSLNLEPERGFSSVRFRFHPPHPSLPSATLRSPPAIRAIYFRRLPARNAGARRMPHAHASRNTHRPPTTRSDPTNTRAPPAARLPPLAAAAQDYRFPLPASRPRYLFPVSRAHVPQEPPPAPLAHTAVEGESARGLVRGIGLAVRSFRVGYN
ncbi:hypothetical protein GGX14DRAFT_677379 [Mycena pura]|uniref:Uncharacterized protein n=1 Tax=Mycena pura TaxID=153505 RepID=A0AAD6Y1R9_9AGAR|nr:hypothetical protein GGX14DRAFT_677379 [Mycena pura]